MSECSPDDKTALQIIRLAVEQAERIKGAADMLEATALSYDGDNPVYSGRNVANILCTEATRIRLGTLAQS